MLMTTPRDVATVVICKATVILLKVSNGSGWNKRRASKKRSADKKRSAQWQGSCDKYFSSIINDSLIVSYTIIHISSLILYCTIRS